MRERVEAARSEKEETKPSLVRRSLSKPATPFKKLRLGDRKVTKVALIPLRFIKKVLSWIVPRYFVNAWRELRQVQWTSRRETWRLTLAVFIFAIVFGALVAGVDKGLDEIFKKVVLK
ncbi:MAG: preprotein translocase subunit SecE [Candidatus Saccharimonadales bacterium]